MVRSLGVPVKSSDKRDPKEAEACIPKMMSTTPTTSKAIPITLCIPLSSCALRMLWQSDSNDGIDLPSLFSFFAALIDPGNDHFVN